MNPLKRRIPSVVSTLLLIGIVSVPGSAVYGVTVGDCKSIEIASCDDVDVLNALCDKLFSDPRPCEELCKSVASGDQVGACMVCCNNIKGELNLDQRPRRDWP
jgi:hypothetical protein